MNYYPRWKIILILGVIAFGFITSLPNIIGRDGRAWVSENLPSWVPSQSVNLGLDLQGGSYILLDIDFDVVFSEMMDGISDAVRRDAREKQIVLQSVTSDLNTVTVKLSKPEDIAPVRAMIALIEPQIEIVEEGLTLSLKRTDAQNTEIINHTISQTIEIVRRRVDETGTNEPVIQRQGDRRVLVQLPGVDNPERIKNLLGKTAKLGFHLVDERATSTGRGGAGALVLPMLENPAQQIGVKRRAMITGDMLTNAATGFSEGMPVVSFRLDARGADRFCQISTENVGKPFAIVLDNQIISAPVLREPICGGQGQISGGFSVEEANDLSLLLRAGALPAPLTIAEERTIGPSLGADSVEAGKNAALVSFAMVFVFMFVCYSTFGFISIIALFCNIILIFAILSMLQATLTLPGIAGIVLTIGMAVDANILIYERIREDYLSGKSIASSIQSGFNSASSSIIDSNLTGLIAGIILFSFGTGAIKGFAVTLMIGILTTMFTAVTVTRLIIYFWLKACSPKHLPLVKRHEVSK